MRDPPFGVQEWQHQVTEPHPCECQIILSSERKALFTGLDKSEKYFPMVSREGQQSLLPVPPSPLAPSSVDSTSPVMSIPALLSPSPSLAHSDLTRMAGAALQITPPTPPNEKRASAARLPQSHPHNHVLDYEQRTGSQSVRDLHSNIANIAYNKDVQKWNVWDRDNLVKRFSKLSPRSGTFEKVCRPVGLVSHTCEPTAYFYSYPRWVCRGISSAQN